MVCISLSTAESSKILRKTCVLNYDLLEPQISPKFKEVVDLRECSKFNLKELITTLIKNLWVSSAILSLFFERNLSNVQRSHTKKEAWKKCGASVIQSSGLKQHDASNAVPTQFCSSPRCQFSKKRTSIQLFKNIENK